MPPAPDANPRPRIRGRKRTLLMVLLLLAYAAGGAIINVAVAWGCALWVEVWKEAPYPGTPINAFRSSIGNPSWKFSWLNRVGAKRYIEELVPSELGQPNQEADAPARPDLVPRWSRMLAQVPQALSTSTQRCVFAEDVRGWPLLSIRCTFIVEYRGTNGFAVGVDRGIGIENINTPGLAGTPISNTELLPDFLWAKALPLQPIWSSFALNTLFYATLLWLVGWFAYHLAKATGSLIVTLFGETVGWKAMRGRRRIKRRQCPACAYPIGSSDVCTECGAAVRIQRE